MGAVQVGGHEVPQDAPQIWSHVVTGYEDTPCTADEGLVSLPPCKILTVDPVGSKELSLPKAQPVPEVLEAQMPEVPKESGVSQSETQVVQQLNGRRKSLLIGINYFGSASELHGCVDDVHRMLPLVEKWGFSEDGCSKVLLDTPGTEHAKRPTRANIKSAIAWLVEGAAAGDALFFHYSGHGGRVPRTDGRGEWHETLCPVDMDEEGMIHDNELFDMLVKPLPKGCRLTCILDACHSAGALDLPFIFTGTPENIKKAMAGEAVQMALSKNWVQDFERWSVEDNPMALLGDVASVGLGLWDMWKQYKAKTDANEDGFCPDEPGNIGMTAAEVVAITGCASDQTSADVGDVHSQFDLRNTPHGGQIRYGGTAGGALTSAFLEAMEEHDDLSILELLEHLRERLAQGGFSQVPQLASSLVLNLKQQFSLTTVIGQGNGNNCTGMRGTTSPGLLGGLGNGLSNGLGAMGGGGLGGTPYTSSPGFGGNVFGNALGGLGGMAWPGLFHQETSQNVPAEVPGHMSGDEHSDDEDVFDDSENEDFEDEYSDYDDD